MPRAMSTAMLAAIQSRELALAVFLEASFRTGPVYLWSGMGSLPWNGHTWLGVGALGGISMIDESASVEAKAITLTLSGIDPTLLSDVLTEFQLAQPALVYLACFNGSSLIADPVLAFSGRMDQPTLDIAGKTALISINCESRLADMNTAVDRRYTQEDQQRNWPGDLGFSFVNAIQEMTLYWGTAPTSSNNI